MGSSSTGRAPDFDSGGCGFKPHLPRQIKLGIAQLGRASALGAEGRRFESCFPDQIKQSVGQLVAYFLWMEDVVSSSLTTLTKLEN